MKTVCITLLMVIMAVTSTKAAVTKEKRLLNLLGGQNGGLLGSLDKVLSSDKGLVGSLLGQNGVVGSLLGDVLGGDLLGGLLDDNLLKGLTRLVDGLVEEITRFIAQLVDNVLHALENVDMKSTAAVNQVFDSLPCNQLCPTCNALPTAQQCISYCQNKCRWGFQNMGATTM